MAKDIKAASTKEDQKNHIMIRVNPGFQDGRKVNIVQMFVPAIGDKPESIVDQEIISGVNLWLTKRCKRALAKMIRRQQLVAAFVASVR